MSTTMNNPLLVNWAGAPKGIAIKDGDETEHAVRMQDFVAAIDSAEQARQQDQILATQDALRVASLIADQALLELDPGTATTGDISEEINKIRNILTNLVQQGKTRA